MMRHVGLVAMVAFSLTAAMLMTLQVRQSLAEADARAMAVAQIAGTSARAYLIAEHYLDLLTKLNDLTSQDAVLEVDALSLADGVRLEGRGRSMLYNSEPTSAERAALESGAPVMDRSPGATRVTVPIEKAGQVIGFVQVDYARPDVTAVIADLALPFLATVLVALLVTTPLTIRAGGRMADPLRRIAMAMRRASMGRDDLGLPEAGTLEERLLARSLQRTSRAVRGNLARATYKADIDVVTGLPNHRRFREDGRIVLNQAAGHRVPSTGTLLIVDLGGFQRINDIAGHEAGDGVLAHVADALRGVVLQRATLHPLSDRETAANDPDRHARALLRQDVESQDAETLETLERTVRMGRIGGDVFAILCPGLSKADATAVGHAMVDRVTRPLEVSGFAATLTASVGTATYPADADHMDALLVAAKLAGRAAKDAGADTVHPFVPRMKQQAADAARLVNEIKAGIARGEFFPVYQPQVSATSRSVMGFEALARWRHPERGVLSPFHFIEAAERNGLINAIGKAILERACQDAAVWQEDRPGLRVAVNVSMRQFEDPAFAETVLDALASSGLPGRLLELELTESLAMSDPKRIEALIAPLRAEGITFAIDDFGTGYASLSHLTRLPFDVLKIDRSFVQHIEDDETAQTMVRTILAMARALGYECVAEGIETPAQARFVDAEGCGALQGFLFAKPMDAAYVAAWVGRMDAPANDLRPDELTSVATRVG